MPQLTLDLPPPLAAPLMQLARHLGYDTAPGADTLLTLHEASLLLQTPRGEQRFALPVTLGALASALHQLQHTPTHPLPAGWQFDPRQRQCWHPTHAPINLTDKESLLLTALIESSVPLTRDQLTRDIWGHESGVDSHTFDTHLYRLRGKLEAIPNLTITAENSAYTLLTK